MVITGSTRGIGYGLALEFARLGHQVTVSGRTPQAVSTAVSSLSALYPSANLQGEACDMTRIEEVQKLWQTAATRFGKVDIWINNAGQGNPRQPFQHLAPEQVQQVVQTNLLGMMYGSQVALQGMEKQGFGQIYNMEGQGSNGNIRPGLILYGTTKIALTCFTRGLIKENVTGPVQINYLSPGMVISDLLLQNLKSAENPERVRRFFNHFADPVETVTPYLVEQILANKKHGRRIAWLTPTKILWRFATLPFSHRELIASDPTLAREI